MAGEEAPALSEPSFQVKGLSFCVTGGSRGLGWCLGQELAKAGAANILLIGGRGESPGPASEWRTEEGCEMKYVKADLAHCEGVEAAASEMRSYFAERRLDGLANVAGVAFPRGTMAETDFELWDRMMAVNCRAPVFLMRQAVDIMRRQNVAGSIVNVSSVAGLGGAPFIFAYSAAKAALNCATKTAAVECQASRIRVNAVAMGWTETDNEAANQAALAGHNWIQAADASHPMGRLLRPVDIVATLGHYLSPATRMITGTVVHVCPEFIHGALPVGDRTT